MISDECCFTTEEEYGVTDHFYEELNIESYLLTTQMGNNLFEKLFL